MPAVQFNAAVARDERDLGYSDVRPGRPREPVRWEFLAAFLGA